MNEKKANETARAWDKHLENQLIIRIYTREDASKHGASYAIRILAYDPVTPAGYYYIQFNDWDPNPDYAHQCEPFFRIVRLVATETKTPIVLGLSAMRQDFFYEGMEWLDPRPTLSIRIKDGSAAIEEHLSIGAYTQMVSLHTMLMCRDKFGIVGRGKVLNNIKALQPTIRRLEGFISAERANLAKIRNMF